MYADTIGPRVKPMKAVSAKMKTSPSPLSRNFVVRKRSPKYPTRVSSIPGYGSASRMESAAVPAVQSRVSASSR
jgi:hypothetical protein